MNSERCTTSIIGIRHPALATRHGIGVSRGSLRPSTELLRARLLLHRIIAPSPITTMPNTAAAAELHGTDIKGILQSTGPTVKAVLLRHMHPSGRDTKPHASPIRDDQHPHHRQVLTELVEEIEVDTTPAKAQVKEILGGPWTFVGQYEEEGIMLMARKELPEDLESLSIAQLKDICFDFGIKVDNALEKSDFVTALQVEVPDLPLNPHRLQPPLERARIKGDILCLKVAETKEVLDDDDAEEEGQDLQVLSNEEFFLDYFKDAWVAFAARDDVVAPEPPEEEDENDDEEDEDDDDDDDEDFEVGDDDDEEEEKSAMLNFLMGEVLKKFREENGRGPDSEELLEIRSEVAHQLHMVLPQVPVASEEETKKKRQSTDDAGASAKRVKFNADEVKDDNVDKEEDETKEAATKEDKSES